MSSTLYTLQWDKDDFKFAYCSRGNIILVSFTWCCVCQETSMRRGEKCDAERFSSFQILFKRMRCGKRRRGELRISLFTGAGAYLIFNICLLLTFPIAEAIKVQKPQNVLCLPGQRQIHFIWGICHPCAQRSIFKMSCEKRRTLLLGNIYAVM